MHVPTQNTQTFLPFQKLFKYYLFGLAFRHSSSGLPVDELALFWIMKHDHAKDSCASDIGPLMIRRYMCLRDVATRLLSYLIKPNQYSPFLGQMISF